MQFSNFLSGYLKHNGIKKINVKSDLIPFNNKIDFNNFIDNITGYVYRHDICLSDFIEIESCVKNIEEFLPARPSAEYSEIKNKFLELKKYVYDFRRKNMVCIPDGKIQIGNYNGLSDQTPPHNIIIKSFFIDSMPVSVKSFLEICPEFSASIEEYDFDDEPVRGVSFSQASIFAKRIGKRIPSEFEWYYASATSENNKYFSGRRLTGCALNATKNWVNCRMNNKSKKNFFGLYYMTGLVWEWTDSWYLPYPNNYEKKKEYGYKYKVLKGGCWNSPKHECDNNFRKFFLPEQSSYNIGFRCSI
ncbi:MAG TPA: formylglycine-generating enzyme family protein [bacterium]|nr:formylglycine-generating enzyme family protein [bacterium]